MRTVIIESSDGTRGWVRADQVIAARVEEGDVGYVVTLAVGSGERVVRKVWPTKEEAIRDLEWVKSHVDSQMHAIWFRK